MTLFFLQACLKGGGDCTSQIDGYYIESLVCVLFGLCWLSWGRRTVNNLQSLKEDAWQVFIQPKHKN
jgi:PAT family acetyl-CoA transporter-like MFS transporter 1